MPQARYRPLPVTSRTPSSPIRLSAPRCVTLATFAIIGADTIGLDNTSSMAVGRLLEERRPFKRRVICSRACVNRAISFMPASAEADIASRKASRHVKRFRDRRRSLGTAFSPTLNPNRCEATFPRARR